MENIIIRAKNTSNLLEAIEYYFEREAITFSVCDKLENIDEKADGIIYIQDLYEDISLPQLGLPIILISTEKKDIECPLFIQTILTHLLIDSETYTDVQKDYLFKKGSYSVFLNVLSSLIKGRMAYNHIIYDLRDIKTEPDNWIFKFDSIAETYSWLSKMDRNIKENEVRKAFNFYNTKIYNDSNKEINYLTDLINYIKSGNKMIDIFVCTKEELNLLKQNYFFKSLLRNISSTYEIYYVDKEKLMNNDSELYESLLDGIIIYEDCVYRDTYQDELSLGYVDCNKDTIEKYTNYFDKIKEQYGISIGEVEK